MIERIDKNTIRIYNKDKGVYYYLEIPEGHNLIVIEKAFLRGFEEGEKCVK